MQAAITFLNGAFGLLVLGNSLTARYAFLVLIGVISAVVFLWIFKRVSNQQRIRLYKNRVWGNILQMRLYQDKFRVIGSSILKVAGWNLLYLKEMIVPLVVLLVPLAAFTMQVNNYCGYSPLPAGGETVVRAVIDEAAAGGVDFELMQRVELEPGDGVTLQTPALRIVDEAAVLWRVSVAGDGARGVRVVLTGNGAADKLLASAGHGLKGFAPVLQKWSFPGGLAYNAEGFLPGDSPFRAIEVTYQRQQYPFLWWELDSLIVYFILVLVFAVAFKPLFRVAL